MSLLSMNDIYLPVTDLERSTEWFRNIFEVQLEWLDGGKGKITFANNRAIILVQSAELNHYSHIPFNLVSQNMVKSRSMLIEKRVRVSKSSITDGFHCFDFFDLDENRLGLVGAEVPENIDVNENIAVCTTFLAVKHQ